MEIKRRAEYDYQTDNIIEFILRARGVKKEDVKHFLFPDESIKPDYKRLNNINEGLELLHKHIEKRNHIRIPVDFDADGFTSAAIIYQFITKDLGHDNVSQYIPNSKVHGINLQDTLGRKPDLMMVTDASSSESSIHKTLKENGIDTLIVDHHLVDGEPSQDAVVINNQTSHRFPWKELTGAAMTHLFCEAYRDKYNVEVDLDKYLDLVAIGTIADTADLRDKGAFYYTQKGLRKIHNPLVKHIIEKSNNVSEPLTPKDVSFTIAPLINAMTRSGTPEDVKIVVDALLGKDYEVYNSRLKDDFHVVIEAGRKAQNTKNRQNKEVAKALEAIEERIEEMGTADNQVLMVNSTGIIQDSGINGLCAIKLAEKYKRPTLVLQYYEDSQTLKGSGRNFSNSPLTHFKDTLEESGVFEYAAGHQSALGVGIKLDNAGQVVDVLNEQLAHIEYDNLTHYVDLEYVERPDAEDIINIAKHNNLWANGIDEPSVYVRDIKVKKSDIKFIGARETTWKLDTLGITDGIMFNLSEEQKLELTRHDSENLLISIVGSCDINTFRGQQRPQILIKDFEVREDTGSPWSNFEVDALPF